MRIDVRILSRAVTEISFRGCVPHLPAPGCWPEREESVPRPCFPAIDLLTGGRDGGPQDATPRSGRSHGARRR
jgi:hypothetical protein